MLALFNSAGWQSNATQRVCCIYLNFIFILFISNLFHFLPLQSIVCRVRRWTSLGSLCLLKKKEKKPFKELPNCHPGGPKYWERNDTRRRDFAVAARATKLLIVSSYTAGQHTTNGPRPFTLHLPYPTSSELQKSFFGNLPRKLFKRTKKVWKTR